MNQKINKVAGDIDKTKEKIAEQQARLKELERLKTELENADIVAMVRGIDIPPAELEVFARAFMEQRKTAVLPDNLTPGSGETSSAEMEDDDIDEKEASDGEE